MKHRQNGSTSRVHKGHGRSGAGFCLSPSLTALLASVSSLALLLPIASPAAADNWIGGTASWFLPGSWQDNSVPTSGDEVFINGGTALVDNPGAQASTTYVGQTGTGAVEISNGGALTSGSVFVGYGSSGDGTVTVTGKDSLWNAGTFYTLGLQGTGALLISDGGGVTNWVSHLGSAGGTGTATVTGAGSRWIHQQGMVVGEAGDGTLTISAGGAVTNTVGVIGWDSTSSGTVAVTGAGSEWSNSNSISIGTSGSGTLVISDGGRVSASQVSIGINAGSTGTLTLNGTEAGGRGVLETAYVEKGRGSATLNLNGGILRATADEANYLRGFDGGGVAIDAGGAYIDTDNYDIGISADLNGDGGLTIMGAGTLTLTGNSNITGDLSVCQCGGLTILGSFIAGGAVLVEGGSLTVAQGGSLTSAQFGSLDGDITISGKNTVVTADLVGLQAAVTDAVLDISSGARFVTNQDASLASIAFGFASAQVRGTGSSWNVGGELIVGDSLDDPSDPSSTPIPTPGGLSISDGGSVTAAKLTIGEQGQVQVGDGASVGFLTAGTVANDGDLTFNHPGALTFAAPVTGIGTLTKSGTGLLVLTGNNTYTGGTTISAGTLQVGDGGLSGSIAGNVVNNGTLAFNRSDDIVFSGVVSGAGGVVQKGPGTLTLSGSNTYSGPTTVAIGTLRVDGSVAGPVRVESGATLGGSGAVQGAAEVRDGGTLVGASGQTLNFGSLSLASAATLNVGLNAGGTDPLFAVAGDLALDGRLAIGENSDLSGGTSYKLLSYGGTLTGSPLALTSAPIGYKLSNFALESGSGEVRLTLIDAAGQQYWTQGSGLWNSFGWSNPDGSLLTRWQGDTAVFRGTGGTVTVEGPQSFSALRFEADGYRIVPGTGGLLTIAGARGDVRVESGRTATIAAPIGGAGGLAKGGAGTLILSGLNTYQGGTRLAAGTLGIASDASLGASSGGLAIEGGARLWALADFASARTITLGTGGGIFDTDAHAVTLSGPVSGSGSLSKLGTGTLTLSDNNTYAGGTTIGEGTLVGSATSFGSGAIANNATLVVDQATDADFANAIAGTGRLVKTGSGRLNLTGTSPFSGRTEVQAGRLAVNGSLGESVVTVTGGSLGGTGTVGGLVARNGATIAPGNSIGTLNVSGNVAFASGSTYEVEIDAAGQSDRIAASGTATLSGGTVQILPDRGTGYVANRPYTILTAQGGVSGRFDGTSGGKFAFVTPTLGYDSRTVTLTLVREAHPVAFHAEAATPNQYRTADGIEALGEGNRLFDTVLVSSVAGARQAFDALSGEAHASAATLAYGDARLVQQSVLSRLRARSNPGPALPAFAQGAYSAAYAADGPGAVPQPAVVTPSFDPRRFAFWGEGFGSWGKIDGNGNAAGMDTSTGGFILGADASAGDTFRIGVAGGFTRTSFDIDARLSSGANETVFGALYGSGQWGAFNLRLGAAYAHHDLDLTRTISFPGFADRTSASYNGSTLQAFGELGYRLVWGGAAVEPFVGASVLRLHTDAFRENGGAAALTGYAQDHDLGTTTVGVRAEARIGAGMPLTLRGLLGWRHAYGDVEPSTLLAFAGGASPFTVGGVPVDRDALVAEAGLDWQASEAVSLGVSYQGQIGSRAQDHAVKGSFTWRFGTR
ncbi:autotransporter domain-containing protein [Microvirga lenta]|uniref:autotransporter domain-containing protein n=1 Tax=Microvirga lenta TaxID=2881337 RepID=UPI001CFF9EA6|nr:autotransporter domain-containing protein [Microvirga lenta]MCB5175667.1 autotransporter domain-containing protein [Microvirga lenta]